MTIKNQTLSEEINQTIAKVILNKIPAACFYLDKDNILWKTVDGEMIGKRSVWTFDNRACWLQDTKSENVKAWWCGENADYNEIFKTQ